jgi:hypothetical protein
LLGNRSKNCDRKTKRKGTIRSVSKRGHFAESYDPFEKTYPVPAIKITVKTIARYFVAFDFLGNRKRKVAAPKEISAVKNEPSAE